jgi:hypothetical protein
MLGFSLTLYNLKRYIDASRMVGISLHFTFTSGPVPSAWVPMMLISVRSISCASSLGNPSTTFSNTGSMPSTN